MANQRLARSCLPDARIKSHRRGVLRIERKITRRATEQKDDVEGITKLVRRNSEGQLRSKKKANKSATEKLFSFERGCSN